MSMKRFRVAGHSMVPTLRPGQEVVAVDTRRPTVGNLVVFEHPERPGFWLIKRLVDDSGWVLSDDPDHGDSDSRTLGAIAIGDMWDVVAALDADTFVSACHLLMDEDDRLAELAGRWGLPDFWQRQPGFKTLVWLILEQQVSLESGAAMFRRLADLVGDIAPHSVFDAGEDALRSIGVTRQKTSYLLDLAGQITTGQLDLAELESQPTHVARDTLISIRGIGPWTADAYLLSALRRPDMWPVGDRALQVGTAEALGMRGVPDEEELEILAEPWRPVRAAAARLIWHAYLSERGRIEPTDPTLEHDGSRHA
jgi:DNA-3-methyladenine glycosylase II